MQYFKKFPVFFAAMAVLVVAFVAGAVYDGVVMADVAKSEKKLKNARADFSAALSEDPTQATLDAGKKNIDELAAHLDNLEKDLTRAHDDIFSAPPSESYMLNDKLRGLVRAWKRTAGTKGIAIAPEMEFGYKRYVAAGADQPKDEAVAPVWKQACVLNYINGKLFACKTEQSPMAVVRVQREVLDAEKEVAKKNTRLTAAQRRAALRRSASDAGEETFTIDPNITARKQGSLDTIAFKFVFAGHTDILRRFLNELKNFDAMLVVRSIDVKPAGENVNTILNRKPEEEGMEGLADLFGTNNNNKDSQEGEGGEAQAQDSAAQTSQASKTPVVTDNLSEFSVVVEYVEVVKDKPAKKVKTQEQE